MRSGARSYRASIEVILPQAEMTQRVAALAGNPLDPPGNPVPSMGLGQVLHPPAMGTLVDQPVVIHQLAGVGIPGDSLARVMRALDHQGVDRQQAGSVSQRV